jgi:hypothetical protein
MAENKKDTQTKKAGAPGKKGGGKAWIIILMTVFGASAWFILPSLMLLVGMLPTVVEMFFGNDRNGSKTTAIAVLNAAGIVPFVIELWEKGQTMPNALAILNESTTWLVMLGAAGVGWLIVFAIPPAIASLTLANAEDRIALLKQNLEVLKNTWGPEVATTKPLEKVARGE